ncbi:hypothetical protein LTR70_004245 [Exophiala xenobiotica]|uniref:BTB domain-containing protein n=1 Tax=Lithohypha guttulata TaxID=1690604 RepID=A0ABR0KE01_9EURO|nr:hypothetical protein LTR24_003788 [Lithohypha guttulata]KAK5321000.1 hypothetical protein LTR70_004245 [Exophiala xenobiotica]
MWGLSWRPRESRDGSLRVKSTLTHDSLMHDDEYADLTIRAGVRTWKVHRSILCSRCRFFKAACKDGFQEAESQMINLNDDNPQGVEQMLEYLYTLQVPYLGHVSQAQSA